jgi:hypothetical protein
MAQTASRVLRGVDMAGPHASLCVRARHSFRPLPGGPHMAAPQSPARYSAPVAGGWVPDVRVIPNLRSVPTSTEISRPIPSGRSPRLRQYKRGGGIATTPSTRWSWTISGEHDQGAELTECIHGKREASPQEKSSNTVAPTPMCSFGASSGCRGSSGGDRWHRGCHRTSQGIRPTYICPCSKDLGQPCRCT